MISAEIDPSDIDNAEILSKNFRIRGKLHIHGLKSIQINEQPWKGTLKKEYDRASIFDLAIGNNFVELSISWDNYPPRPPINFFSTIRITGEKIWWEPIVE